MTFSVEVGEDIKSLDLPYSEIFGEVARAALDHTSCPYECEISLILTDDDDIRRMNKEFRGIDAATDVLSFPMIEFDEPGDFGCVSGNEAEYLDPDTGDLMLGDIVISTDHVLAQAEAYGHSVKREFAFLISHSMLHLQGFDHIEPGEAAVMEAAQEQILDKLKIRR
ncbi:MAG: rRNA maturation RNase YbeY [Lachnospiraceae bacterium]|nr:rRNA maturation RNase YbeY [Lachnospiraceae bacterium]